MDFWLGFGSVSAPEHSQLSKGFFKDFLINILEKSGEKTRNIT